MRTKSNSKGKNKKQPSSGAKGNKQKKINKVNYLINRRT